ncbi:NAD(P)/FAD-dependent oxidoreductase [Pontibacter akesuensis]|uniref:Dehydrogenase (Flavoprotein) n=1 Tax=Pontibacter akesuensis TaxID=388950 RepID=A0A1I7IDK1_9BACT|nr:NAD(P)/FAD-dependent oxidoreductase [Pontibacter akesuensis]GHA66635.1 FAD-dependent oxidoreductase [Pontibacter akesuensis]SFU71017.1 Dehydrogenase (flavoprotein) [Pontibacter akesuensis]
MTNDVLVIGGGLAGLVSALGLARAGLQVKLVEKKAYPFHKVCGEYVSNEVLPYLCQLGVSVSSLGPARINRFLLTSPTGKELEAKLDLGGFGLSRFTLDNYLYQLAEQAGVRFILQKTVREVSFENDIFTAQLSGGQTVQARVAIGAYGKRSNLDRQLNRRFFQNRSPYIGVKYHVKYDFPRDLIALHNFKDGYAGTSAIEGDCYCLCYLTTRDNLKKHGTIPAMEQAVLYRNPHLRHIFETGEFMYEQPEVINEVSFATKTCVEDHILMGGDSAGMITPLCGNGMAIAIHSAKLLTEQVLYYFSEGQNRQALEAGYTRAWKKQFESRLRVGRTVQNLFGSPVVSEVAVGALKHIPAAVKLIMRRTHGQPF